MNIIKDFSEQFFSRKIIWVILSFAAFTWISSWQFAIALMVMLAWHESGHLWAARKFGFQTHGFKFYPFLGAIARFSGTTPSRWAEYYIAVMGPAWGFGLAAVWGGIYWLTKDPMWAVLTFFGAFINLFNLLPVNPMDGGRICRSILSSIDFRLGLMFAQFSIVLALMFVVFTGNILFAFLIYLAYIDLGYILEADPVILKNRLPARIKKGFAELAEFEKAMKDPPQGHMFWEKFQNIANKSVQKGSHSKEDREWMKMSLSIEDTIEQLSILKFSPDISPMNLGKMTQAALYTFCLGLGLVLLMVYTYHVSGWDVAMKNLIGLVW